MLIDKAKSFIQTMYSELKYNANEIENRMKEIEQEINLTGSYTHTYEELSYGAKMAWRNSNRCIGRFFWDSLNVKDVIRTNEKKHLGFEFITAGQVSFNPSKLIDSEKFKEVLNDIQSGKFTKQWKHFRSYVFIKHFTCFIH